MTALVIGSAAIPDLDVDVPVQVVVPLDQPAPNTDYDAGLIHVPGLVAVVALKELDQVTVTVNAPFGLAGAGTLYVVGVANEDTGWIDVSSYLNAGWTGAAQLRSLANVYSGTGGVVYFQFDLVAAASIDGTPKSASVDVLNGLDSDLQQNNSVGSGSITGVAYDDADQLLGIASSGSVYIPGASTITGTWEDGVSTLRGQVSWVAGT